MGFITYDIFKRDSQGRSIWIEAVRGLERARARVVELSVEQPGQYMVLTKDTGRMVTAGTVVASPGARAAYSEGSEIFWK